MHVHTHAIIKTGQVDTGSPLQLLCKSTSDSSLTCLPDFLPEKEEDSAVA